MNENTPNTSPEPIHEKKTLNRRRALIAASAAGVAGLVAGMNGLSGAEGVPCDPVIDNGCIPDPTTSSLPELTKPSTIPETTVTTSTSTVPETTVTTSTVPETTVPPTHISTPPGMPPMTVAIPGTTTPPAPEAHVTE